MHEDRKQTWAKSVAYIRQHLTGDEKGEAQIFLDRLFKAFELKGVKEAGATLAGARQKARRRRDSVRRPGL